MFQIKEADEIYTQRNRFECKKHVKRVVDLQKTNNFQDEDCLHTSVTEFLHEKIERCWIDEKSLSGGGMGGGFLQRVMLHTCILYSVYIHTAKWKK